MAELVTREVRSRMSADGTVHQLLECVSCGRDVRFPARP